MPRRFSKPFLMGASVVVVGMTSASVLADIRVFLVLSLIDICALMIILDRRQSVSSGTRQARFQAEQARLFNSVKLQLDDISPGMRSGVSESTFRELLEASSAEQKNNEQRLRQLGQLAQKQLSAIERVEAHVQKYEESPVQVRALAQWRHQISEDLAWMCTQFGNDFHESNMEVANNGDDE
ncbi:hypothetical protein [Arthrobacter sp. 179]|uniref:hypothetical protein n=1 Tax=Arthrobacter sp. 179 TaxID=3457734 RepID=UPI0040344E4F